MFRDMHNKHLRCYGISNNKYLETGSNQNNQYKIYYK